MVKTLSYMREPHIQLTRILTSNLTRSYYTWTLFRLSSAPHIAFFYLEILFNIWFTLELLIRFLVSPEKFKFIKDLVNIIDFLATLSYYFDILFLWTNVCSSYADICEITTVIRVFRLFKLTNHLKGFKILLITFKASLNELSLLIFFLLIIVIIFATIVFYAEKINPSPDNQLENVFISVWWAIVSA